MEKYLRRKNKLKSLLALGEEYRDLIEEVERVKQDLKKTYAGTIPNEPVVIAIDGSHGTGKTAVGDILREALEEILGKDRIVMISRGDLTDLFFEEIKRKMAERYGINPDDKNFEEKLLEKMDKKGEDVNKVVGDMLTEEESVDIDRRVLDLMVRLISHSVREGKHVIVEGDGSSSIVRAVEELSMLPVRTIRIFLTTTPRGIERVLKVRGETPRLDRIVKRLYDDAKRYERLAQREDLNEFLRYLYKSEAQKTREIAKQLEKGEAPRVNGYDVYLEVKHHPRVLENAPELLRELVKHVLGWVHEKRGNRS